MAVDWCVCWCLSEFLVKSCVQEDWMIALVLVESYESRCEKHAACLNWDAGLLRGGFSSEAPATKWKLTKSCLPLTVLARLLLFLSSDSFCAYFDWLSWLFQFATWQYTDVHQLSVQKWLFNNTVVLFFLRSLLKDLWAITGPLLVKSLSGQVEAN